MQTLSKIGQRFYLCESLIDPIDQDVLQGDHLPLLFQIVATSLSQFGQRILPVDRHDLVPDHVGGSMKRNCQAELLGFIGQLADFWSQTTGGDGDFSGTDPAAPGSV